jgi:hypothetical protein
MNVSSVKNAGSITKPQMTLMLAAMADWEEIGNNAEENKEIADSLISEVYDTSNHLVTCDYPSLWVRTIETEDQSPEAKKALDDALASFEGQFSFEAKQIFVNNIYAYEIELPRIIYNF